MSASQEKKLRKLQREEGTDKYQIAKQKAEEAKKRRQNTQLSLGIVVAAVILAVIIFNSNLFYSNFTAVKIGDESYTAAEYSFFYTTTYNNFVNQYGQYLSMMGLDTTQSLASQQYTEDQTWADFFKESALDTMKDITALYAEAQQAGFELSDEYKASLESSIESLNTSYEGSDYPSADAYLAAVYGKGCNVKVISNLLEKYYISQAFAEQMNDSFTYTDDELKAYYEENKDDFDNYTYISYFADGSEPDDSTDSSDEADVTDEADASDATSETDIEASPDTDVSSESETSDAMESAKAVAESIIADAATADEFKQAVLAKTQADSSEATSQGSSLSAVYADWLKDAARASGDTTVVESDTGYYALYFISRDNNNYKTINVRHILINVAADDSGAYTDEAKAEAQKKAEDLLNEWKAGDETEDSFAELANANSEDTGSNTTGGLYENVIKSQMVTEFNDWCFAEGRKTGDTGIVYNEGSYCGYHIIYFVGEDKLYCDKLAEDALRSTDYSDWKTSILENYEADTGFTAALVK